MSKLEQRYSRCFAVGCLALSGRMIYGGDPSRAKDRGHQLSVKVFRHFANLAVADSEHMAIRVVVWSSVLRLGLTAQLEHYEIGLRDNVVNRRGNASFELAE